MSDKVFYKYTKSPRKFALEILSISITFTVSVWIAASLMPIDSPTDDYVKYGAIAIGIFIFLIFGLPNWNKKGQFLFEVTDAGICCQDPTSESLNYRIQLQDIKEIYIQRAIGSETGNDWYWIVTDKDERYVIPYAFTLSPLRAFKIIKKHFPNITINDSKSRTK